MNEEEFDSQYQAGFSELLESAKWPELITLCKFLLKEKNPTPSMRIELLTGIAMAQVGLAAQFTEALKQQGLTIRDEVGMTQEEARIVAENVATCVKLKADGLGQVSYPAEGGSS